MLGRQHAQKYRSQQTVPVATHTGALGGVHLHFPWPFVGAFSESPAVATLDGNASSQGVSEPLVLGGLFTSWGPSCLSQESGEGGKTLVGM